MTATFPCAGVRSRVISADNAGRSSRGGKRQPISIKVNKQSGKDVIGSISDVVQLIENAFKSLFEEKHLYQSISIDEKEINRIADAAGRGPAIAIKSSIEKMWVPEDTPQGPKSQLAGHIFFKTPHVKSFCTTCDRVEAYSHVSTSDVTGIYSENQNVQVFAVSYLCQSCRDLPEVFIVRRERLKLVLCGRAPIENVYVPNDIPKSVRRFYSGAIVAHQSGQTLAGNFLLRCLIEHWSREATKEKDMPADQTIDSYMKSLPGDFNARFPSVRESYGKLSADIHRANWFPRAI